MQRLILVLCLSLSFAAVFSQNLKVEIRDRDGSLPYGYIFVNGKIRAISDSSGVANLSVNELKTGDTISASYIGHTPKWAIFGSKTDKNQPLELLLDVDIANIGTITVEGNADKFFAKKVKPAYMVKNGILTADFDAQIEPSDQPKSLIAGRFSAKNEVANKKFKTYAQYGYFHHPIQCSTISGTVGLSETLNQLIKEAITASFQIDVFVNSYYRKTYGPNLQYKYVGKSDNIMVFRVIDKGLSRYIRRSLGLSEQRKTHFPQLLYVDEKTGNIIKYEMDFRTDATDEVGSLEVKVEYAYSKIGGVNVFIPAKISFISTTGKFATKAIHMKNLAFIAQ